MQVSYKQIASCKEAAATMRALGIWYFTAGQFPRQEWLTLFNEVTSATIDLYLAFFFFFFFFYRKTFIYIILH